MTERIPQCPAIPEGIDCDLVLVLSTSHIERCDGLLLEDVQCTGYGDDGDLWPCHGAYQQGGWFLVMNGGAESHGWSKTLLNVLKVAESRGWRWVRFDGDADTYDELPTFDW